MLLGPPAPAGAKLILVTADVKLQVKFLRRNNALVAELPQACKPAVRKLL
jgi:hypothetical protein